MKYMSGRSIDYIKKVRRWTYIAVSVIVLIAASVSVHNPGAYLIDGIHYSGEGAVVVAHTVFSYASRYLGTIGQRL